MTQYINKDAFVAEIEDWRDKIKKGLFSIPLTGRDRVNATFEYEILGKVKDFIGTLEVKEVDLKKETLCDKCKKAQPSHSCQDITALGRCALEKQNEQNPAWSDEDEAVLDALIRRLEGEDVYISPHLAAECLKSLKDRVQQQPKQEWSVEDRSKVQRICKYLNEAKKYYADITEVRECIEWLKALIP